ncbi:MAG: tRNA (N6-isopentenyl adenosine(37)-C2)-methylthiotransferase MiaB [Clostridia bacterium]|nr:tRNA (N6-isopentenyl adenosine(37)-C2)-methylthiotransferase MiaB [Clostridia bacterium]
MEDITKQLEYIEKIRELNKNELKKYSILTMGCQLNENDSEKLSGMMEKMGYILTQKLEEADLVVFNTCCVRENAEDKLFGKLGEVKRQKELRGTIIAIGGCMMQEKHIVQKMQRSYPFYDFIFGTHTIHTFPENIYKILMQRKRREDVLDIDGEIIEGLPIRRNDDKKASVTIMYGCNNFCSYCIVPYVRGRERSRKREDILSEIESLAKDGYKEITLLGQNVNSYNGGTQIIDGKEVKYGFANLLRDVNKIENIEIIRFISPHPKDFTDDVILAIKECSKVSKIIHLPLQSGSTSILKKMNRKYTKEQYLKLVEKMEAQIPNVVFSTDIIVGFPGEEEEDFEETLDVVRKVNFEQVFMFIYSIRVGTPAARMEDQVLESIKHSRFERLKKLVESQVEQNNLKYIGTIQKVLVEGKSKTNDKMLTGRTSTNKVVIFEGDENLINTIINLEIISEHKWYLKGKI